MLAHLSQSQSESESEKRRRWQAERLAEKARDAVWDSAIENFRAKVLPAIFPQVKNAWRYKGYGTNSLWIEPRELIDHPRLFAHGRKRNDFVLVSMPYCNVPESETATGYEWGCQYLHEQTRGKLTLRFHRLPDAMSWHMPGWTRLILMWPENGIQPDFRGLDA